MKNCGIFCKKKSPKFGRKNTPQNLAAGFSHLMHIHGWVSTKFRLKNPQEALVHYPFPLTLTMLKMNQIVTGVKNGIAGKIVHVFHFQIFKKKIHTHHKFSMTSYFQIIWDVTLLPSPRILWRQWTSIMCENFWALYLAFSLASSKDWHQIGQSHQNIHIGFV